jgi:hypothetical protein
VILFLDLVDLPVLGVIVGDTIYTVSTHLFLYLYTCVSVVGMADNSHEDGIISRHNSEGTHTNILASDGLCCHDLTVRCSYHNCTARGRSGPLMSILAR